MSLVSSKIVATNRVELVVEAKGEVYTTAVENAFRKNMKKITVPVEIDCMKVSSYGAGTVTTGSVNIHLDLVRPDLDTCDILIIEDIIDSGVTLSYLTKYLMNRNPASLRIVTLLDKPSRRKAEVFPAYKGFEVEDNFVVGYGLDYAEKYRNLPYIGILKPEVYS